MPRLLPFPTAAVALLLATALTAFSVSCFSDRGVTATTAGTATCQVGDTPSVDGSTIVVIRGYAFHPAQVRVHAGERVTWVNCESTSGLSHTSSADGRAWVSDLIAPGTSFTHTFDAPGSFDYHCDPHPFMRGTVIVD